MKITTIIVLFLLLTGTAIGQNSTVVPDTLDWKRYYPLEIGNTWEYGGLNSFVSTIIGDTLANDHRYFVRKDSIPAVGTLGPFIHIFYTRYDIRGTVVTVPNLEADTTVVPLPFDFRQVENPDHLAHFDMRTAFGDTLYFNAALPPDSFTDTLYWVTGNYGATVQINTETVLVGAKKCFREKGFSAGWTECYATDIGFIGGGNLFASELRYAKIGGVEYGKRRSTSIRKDASLPEHLSIESVFPNPTLNTTTINFQLSRSSAITIEVFDALGRRLQKQDMLFFAAGSHSATLEFAERHSGIYFLRLSTENGEEIVRSLIVSR